MAIALPALVVAFGGTAWALGAEGVASARVIEAFALSLPGYPDAFAGAARGLVWPKRSRPQACRGVLAA
jgi:hypothetical protein